jgi:hypothetical protein
VKKITAIAVLFLSTVSLAKDAEHKSKGKEHDLPIPALSCRNFMEGSDIPISAADIDYNSSAEVIAMFADKNGARLFTNFTVEPMKGKEVRFTMTVNKGQPNDGDGPKSELFSVSGVATSDRPFEVKFKAYYMLQKKEVIVKTVCKPWK